MPPSIKSLPITQKLTLVNVTLALFLTVAGGSLLFWQNHRLMHQAMQLRVAQHGAMVGENLVRPIELSDWQRAATILETFEHDPAIAVAELRGVSDELIVTYLGPNPPPSAEERARLHREDVPLFDDYGMEIGSLVIFVARDEVLQASRDLLVAMLVILGLATLAGLGIGQSSQRMVTEPLERLGQLVRKVRATKDYTLRLDPLYPDEVGRLTADVNAMLDIIRRRDQRLAETVEDRTRELEAQNTRLQREIAERERTEKAARASKAKFENAFVNAPIGMALVLADGRVIQRNDMFDRLLETHGNDELNLLPLIRGDARDDVREELQQLVIGSQQTFSLDADCVSSAGRELTCALHFSAIREDADFLYAVLQLQDATESRRLAAELAHQARHDALTGLPNRRAFEQTLGDLSRPSAVIAYPLTIGLIDLDKFKAVNDDGGHAAGDALLQRVAEAVRGAVRERDMVVRLGGDEFAVILRRCDAATGARIAEVIRARIEDLGFTWEGKAFQVGASIGVVSLTRPAESLDEALRRADAACFAAKNGGRNQVCIVGEDDAAPAESDRETHWARRLQEAVVGGDFHLVGQQIRDLTGNDAPRRLEVCLRLRDPDDRGGIRPGAFLPVAERCGLAPRLDRWVAARLLDRMASLAPADHPADELWVNVSAATLEKAELLDFLLERLTDPALPRGLLNFEMREGVLARDLRAVRHFMDQLQPLGCRFAIDDFGSGAASLSYLKSLPVDVVKIDGNLVRDITDDRVDHIFVRSLIDVAHELNIATCAKHVETPEILDAVQDLGAEQAQGFAIHRPVPLFDDPVESAAPAAPPDAARA